MVRIVIFEGDNDRGKTSTLTKLVPLLQKQHPEVKIGCYHDTDAWDSFNVVMDEKYGKDWTLDLDALFEFRTNIYKQLLAQYDIIFFDRSFLSTIVYQIKDFQCAFEQLGSYTRWFEGYGVDFIFYFLFVGSYNMTEASLRDKEYDTVLSIVPPQCKQKICWNKEGEDDIVAVLLEVFNGFIKRGKL